MHPWLLIPDRLFLAIPWRPILQETGASLFAGKTAFDDTVKSEAPAVTQAAPSESAFSKAGAAGMGDNLGTGQVRQSKDWLLLPCSCALQSAVTA